MGRLGLKMEHTKLLITKDCGFWNLRGWFSKGKLRTNRNRELNNLVGSRPYSSRKGYRKTSIQEERGCLGQGAARLSAPGFVNPAATMIVIAPVQINRKDISLRYQTFYGKHPGNNLKSGHSAIQAWLLMVKGSVQSCTSVPQDDKTEQSQDCHLRANTEKRLVQIHDDSQQTLEAMGLHPSL